MKILDTIRYANTNLLRNKVRTLLTVIAIFVGAFTLALTTGIDTGVNRYIDAQLGNVGGKHTIIITPKMPDVKQDNNKAIEFNPNKGTENNPGSTPSSPKPISDETLEKIKQISGVKTVAFYTSPKVDFITSNETDKKFIISLQERVPGISIDTETGEAPNNDSQQPEISLEPKFIESLGLTNAKNTIGKNVELGVTNSLTKKEETISAKVSGVQSRSLINDGYSYVNSATVKAITEASRVGTADFPTPHYAAVATLDENLSKDEITSIKEQVAKLGHQAQTVDDQIGIIRNIINAITGVLTMFAAIALIAASFGIINTLYMAVQERTREIGLMKAMGLGNKKVFMMFSLEAIMIGFWGSVAGIGLAMLAGVWINNIAKDSFLGDLTGFTLIQFSIENIIFIISIICVIAFFAGTMPAVRASKLNPIEALRYE